MNTPRVAESNANDIRNEADEKLGRVNKESAPSRRKDGMAK